MVAGYARIGEPADKVGAGICNQGHTTPPSELNRKRPLAASGKTLRYFALRD
jgi:hypothetical protein